MSRGIQLQFVLFSIISMVLLVGIAQGFVVPAKIELGDASTDASNYYENSNIYRDVTLDINASNVTVAVTATTYSLSTSNPIDTINVTLIETSPGEYKLTARIPEKLPAVDSKGIPGYFEVATIKFTSGSENNSSKLYMQRSNKLEFKEVTLLFGNEEITLRDDKRVDELMAGDSATIEFEVENTFDSAANVKMNDVTVYAIAANDLDFSEDETIGTIEENEEDTETLSIELDEDADEGTHEMIVRVLGKDSYGALHGQAYTAKIELDKESDDIAIKKVDLNPDSVTLCDSRTVSFSVSIDNIGSNDQDEAVIIVESSGLNYRNTLDEIEIDEDETKNKIFPITISSKTKPGVYTINARVFNDDEEETDAQSLSIVVYACDGTLGQSSSTNNQNSNNPNIQVYPQGNQQPIDVVYNQNGQPMYSQVIAAQPMPSSLATTPAVVDFGVKAPSELSMTTLIFAILIIGLLVIIMAVLVFRK